MSLLIIILAYILKEILASLLCLKTYLTTKKSTAAKIRNTSALRNALTAQHFVKKI